MRISKKSLAEMIEEATVDAYGDSELTTGWLTMIENNLEVPFGTTVLGISVTVERIDLSETDQIVAVRRRAKEQASQRCRPDDCGHKKPTALVRRAITAAVEGG